MLYERKNLNPPLQEDLFANNTEDSNRHGTYEHSTRKSAHEHHDDPHRESQRSISEIFPDKNSNSSCVGLLFREEK